MTVICILMLINAKEWKQSIIGKSVINKQEIISVKDFGAVGDGVADDYQALKDAFTFVNQKGGNVTLVFPKGTYYIDRVYHANDFGVELTAPSKSWDGSKNEQITHLFLKDVSNFKVLGNNSTIKVKGDYHKGIDTILFGEKYTYIYPVMPFVFINCSNFSMEGFDINGNGHLTTRESEDLSEAYGYGILLQNSSNFIIRDIYTHNWVTDGLIVGHLDWVTNGKFINVISEYNARQAISIDMAKDLTFKNCKFSYAGQLEGGKYGSHALKAGLDIEPEGGATKQNPTKNLTFIECEFSHNLGAEIIATWEVAENINFIKCKIIRTVSEIDEGIFLGASGVYFEDSVFDFSKTPGVILTNFNKKFSFTAFHRSRFIDSSILSDEENQPLLITNSEIRFMKHEQDDMPVLYIENNRALLKNNKFYMGKNSFHCEEGPCQRLYFGKGAYIGNTYRTNKTGNGYFSSYYGKNALKLNESYPTTQFKPIEG